MPKINNKKPSGKSRCNHPGTCRQYKQYRQLIKRYADWCSDVITKEDIKLAKLYRGGNISLSLEKQTKLMELEKERIEAMFLFCSIGNSKVKGRLKEILRKKIKRINLDARRIIASLDINCNK